jgi:hypothetical protein
LLAQGRLFSPGTPASSTTKTGRHDIAEILLKAAINTNIQIQKVGVRVMVFNATFNNISVISRLPVLLIEYT